MGTGVGIGVHIIMSKIIAYPEIDLITPNNIWIIQWSKMFFREYKESGRSRKMVPLCCLKCNYTTSYEASAILSKNNNRIPNSCIQCNGSEDFLLNKHKAKERENLPHNGFINWCDSFYDKGVMWVPVVCGCGKIRNYNIKHINQTKKHGLCQKCAGKMFRKLKESNSSWKGGVIKTNYIFVRIEIDNSFFNMVSDHKNFKTHGYILEHRLVMAQSLNRPLEKWEHVHHINQNKHDNKIENLQLVTPDKHSSITAMEREIMKLKAENLQLKEKLSALLN